MDGFKRKRVVFTSASLRDRGGGGDGRAIALPLFCWDLFSRALADMEKITRGIIGLFPKRCTVRASCFRRILENYAVLMEEWDVCLSERLQPDVRARIIGCKT